MKTKLAVLGGALAVAAITIAPARAWQVSPEEHAKHHPGGQAETATPTPQATPAPPAKGMGGMKGMDMAASNARFDELVKKMNAAQGQAKVDAMAELLTVLVREHQTMHGNMANMMSMMQRTDSGAAK